MATKKPMKKFKRYEGGGEVMGNVDPKEAAAKEAGLKASKGEDAGFSRFFMGSIDKPGTEAYKRFGAGRGKDETPTPVTVRPPAVPATPSKPVASSTPLSDDMYSDYGPSAGRSSSETITPSRPAATKPVVPAKPSAPAAQVPRLRDTGPDRSDLINKPSLDKNFSNEGRNKPAPASKPSMDIPKMRDDAKAALDEDPSALMMGGGAAAAAAAALLAKTKLGKFGKLFKGAKASDAKRLERPGTVAGKDFIVRDYEGAAKAGSKGVPKKQLGYSKDTDVTDVMAKKRGGAVKKYASGGTVSSASKRADGIATKGKTRGRMC
jgi:hypothetical protein